MVRERIRLRFYEDGDIDRINIRDGDYLGVSLEDEAGNNTFTVVGEDEVVLAIFGCIVVYDGVASIWALISDDARGYGLGITRYARNLISRWFSQFNLHRMHCLVRQDKTEYQRWIQTIGLSYEGTMMKITPDKRNMDVFALVR